MIASWFLLFLVVLADFSVGRASEFAAPDDQRVVEQPALLEVRDERRGRLVAVPAKLAVTFVVVGVRVPGLIVVTDVIDCHKTDPVLDQPPRQQTGTGEGRVAIQIA